MASDETTASEASSRRKFMKLALGMGGAAAAAALLGPALASRILPGGNPGTEPPPAGPCEEYAAFQSNVSSGGPPKDGIPPIDNPQFVSAEAADYLRPDDIVFGLDHQGVVKAYPQRVLVWHEIANDRVGGKRLSVTYCPLTGSPIAFEAPAAGNAETLGTSGNLVNSNLLMYDRGSDSRWPQILGTAIQGRRCGQVLAEVPLVWTTWGQWKARHPETLALTTQTGFVRDYNRDPYGVYTPDPDGYYTDPAVWFPLMNRSDRFHAKKVFLGVKMGGQQLAIPRAEFRSQGVRDVTLGGVPLVVFYDEGLDVLRAFRREVEGTTLGFELRDGAIVDGESGSVWSPEGVGQEGSYQGVALAPASAFTVMWFAWFAFYPDTQVLA